MHVATVVGTLWSTRKDDSLIGLRFLIVQPLNADGSRGAETYVAADNLGAGIGERVLVVHGRAARYLIGRGHDVGMQTAVAAIIDRMELEDGRTIGTTVEHDTPAGEQQA
jgi:microcompartment protein CcmK/EutM